MKTIHYFKGNCIFFAVVEGSEMESVILCPSIFGGHLIAKIEYCNTASLTQEWYLQHYEVCTREEYLAARYQAQAALAEFFGELPAYTGHCRPVPSVAFKLFDSNLLVQSNEA